MKLLLSAFLLSLSASSFASCLVELSGTNTNPFIENSCREALRECNKYKRTNNIQYGRCEVLDRDYGNGYPPGGGNTNPPGNNNRIIQDFINGQSRNCAVIPYVDGRYHQVPSWGQRACNFAAQHVPLQNRPYA